MKGNRENEERTNRTEDGKPRDNKVTDERNNKIHEQKVNSRTRI